MPGWHHDVIAILVMRPIAQGSSVIRTITLVPNVCAGGFDQFVGGLEIGHGSAGVVVTGLPPISTFSLIGVEDDERAHQVEPVLPFLTGGVVNHRLVNGPVKHDPAAPPALLNMIRASPDLAAQLLPLLIRGVPPTAQVMFQPVQFQQERIDAVVRFLADHVGRSA